MMRDHSGWETEAAYFESQWQEFDFELVEDASALKVLVDEVCRNYSTQKAMMGEQGIRGNVSSVRTTVSGRWVRGPTLENPAAQPSREGLTATRANTIPLSRSNEALEATPTSSKKEKLP